MRWAAGFDAALSRVGGLDGLVEVAVGELRAVVGHREGQLLIAYFSVVYATSFLIHLCSLYSLPRRTTDRSRVLGYLVLVGLIRVL